MLEQVNKEFIFELLIKQLNTLSTAQIGQILLQMDLEMVVVLLPGMDSVL